MLQLKSGSVLIMFLVIFCVPGKSQQVLNSVTIQKKSAAQYRIHYSFINNLSDFDIEKAILKIYRRRNGNIEEIFSLPVAAPASSAENQGQFSFDWTASNGIIQKGDEVQAKIILSLKASMAKQRLNRIPVADAGDFIKLQLPITKPVELNGSKSRDADGKLIFIEWKQLSGPTSLIISHADSLIAHADGEFKTGTYAFELTIKDNLGSVSTSRTALTVKESYWTTQPPPATKTTPAKTNTVPAIIPQKNQTQSSKVQPQTKLKGGPANTAANLLLPGLGHYFVSGNYKGENRKLSAFILTGIYAASIGGTFYFNSKSNDFYKKYNELANYREYQKDANGVIIGMRGVNEAQADQYYSDAKAAHRNSLICLSVGGGILVGDIIYTFLKGSKNKKEWQAQNISFKPDLFISSDGYQTTAGLKIKF
jgi:hypothetical protein